MTALRVLALVLGSLLVGLVGAGCGGAQKAYVPVDSPLKEWEAPEEEDLGEPGTDEDGDQDTGDDADAAGGATPAPHAPVAHR